MAKAVAAVKKAAKPFVMTPKLAPYAIPDEARRIEVKWQKFLSTRPIVSVDEYKKRRPVGDIEEIIPCMLCGNEKFMHLFHPKKKNWEYDVVMCTECDLLFRNPNIIPEHLHKLYDQVNYNNFLSSHYGSDRQQKYESVLYSFRDIVPPKGPLKVLDFGCGNGLFLEVAGRHGYEDWGVDLSPESVEAAKKRRGHNRIWCGDPMDIKELRGQKFDLITLWSVLAHLPRPIDTFSMLRSFLKPGGALLVFTVNANSLQLKANRDAWDGFTRNHLAFFSPMTARKLFKKSGFGEFYYRPHYAYFAKALKARLPPKVWHTYQTSVLEHIGGNMNRMIGINR
ncbi:MAG: class I SAM-dependent methyltransferase [Rhizobiaceae bacterium]|nr:class I SAM-dependent methyltransferase [Rhizobiaceae bacterium]